ncbi:CaiB/BaiF CoA transferase family protein [Paraburkholderia caledonica]|uniref:CaiB/BaiF CoA transferase family protein n=1 Tax=Paraburkholderia caledonica TaxID=134536 RepID=UPI00035E5C6A|nr:CoA transferase [Paraburkholderia caledonica]
MSTTKQALAGIRVLEMATYIAGPFCGTLLAEFGADVIKLEMPNVGDPCRRYGTPTEAEDATLMFLSEGRNKRSITADLRREEGADLVKRLVKEVDVVIENFQPGTLEGWGLGWEDLREHNSKLVMARVTGFGQDGPARNRPGFGRIGVAFGGLGYITGYPDRPPTSPGTATLADYLSGLFAANGVLTALRARDLHGVGQFIDIGLYESVFRILDEMAPAYAADGKVRERSGPASHHSVPHSNFPTKDNRWVSIACTNDKIFERFAKAAGRGEAVGPDGKWSKYPDRRADEAAVNEFAVSWTKSRTRDEILVACEEAQVPCGPIYAIDEIFEDPQYNARGNLLKVQDDRVGEITIPNVVPRLSETPGFVRSLGPALGASNEEVYQSLGLTVEEIAVLRAANVI